MRIILSCLQSLKNHTLPPYDFWRSHFVEGCRESGIECLEVPGVDWAEGLVYPRGGDLDTWRTRTWEIVLAYSRQEHERRPIDYFLGYLYPKQIEAAAVDDLQEMGIPAVNFFCEMLESFGRCRSSTGRSRYTGYPNTRRFQCIEAPIYPIYLRPCPVGSLGTYGFRRLTKLNPRRLLARRTFCGAILLDTQCGQVEIS